MDIFTLIKTRRSVRKFKKEKVPDTLIENILEAGRWAPSGLNNQPWRFMVLGKEKKDALAEYTKYGYIIKSANKIILVFLDKDASYNYEKDLMAIGACIQNMLLYIHSEKLGACWLGEILNQREQVQKELEVKGSFKLEAVLAVGSPLSLPKQGRRKTLKSLILK
ncbi:MAG: nitroreductase family protein [Omnitrophica bacterium]|nr:nitroreductase family protein [Candidatus Omnitrophota bacterium]